MSTASVSPRREPLISPYFTRHTDQQLTSSPTGAATYLGNIFNCASCNTANNNQGATGISDFEALRDSCANQGFAGANQTFATAAANSPTGQGTSLLLCLRYLLC